MDFEKELSEIYPWILKVARKFCCSMQDAEDLAGDTVYKLLVNRDKFDCSKPLQPWCLIIMRNTYIIRYNRNSLIHFTGLDMVDGSAISNCTAHSILFDDLVSTVVNGTYELTVIRETDEIESLESGIDGLVILTVIDAYIDLINWFNNESYGGEPYYDNVTLDNINEVLEYYNGETYEEYLERFAEDNMDINDLINK